MPVKPRTPQPAKDDGSERLAEQLDRLAASAGAVPETVVMPWVGANRHQVTLHTRISNPLNLQLEYLLEKTGWSKREVIEAALEPYLRSELKKLGIKID